MYKPHSLEQERASWRTVIYVCYTLPVYDFY